MRLRFPDLLSALHGELTRSLRPGSTSLVAIDGPDCAGKTTLARALVERIKGDRTVALIHYDDYLNPVERRTQRGAFSPLDFLDNFFDEAALVASVLKPATAPGASWPDVVLVEGLFLLRPLPRSYFDLSIRLDIPRELVMKRALRRDVGILGDVEWVRKHYNLQCLPAQATYERTETPADRCDIHIVCLEEGLFDLRLKRA